jgi:hypothetical protein
MKRTEPHDRPTRPGDAAPTRRMVADPGKDDLHEQRVPDQSAEGILEPESEGTRRRRPPTVDEAGGR